MIDDADDRTNHIQHIVELVERMDYDGVDIDYEGFDPSTREDFSLFIEELATELHARGRLLSIAVHAKTNDEGSWGGAAAQDWPRLSAAVDVFRIMTYDYTSRNEPPGPIGPPQWSMDVLAYAETVVDLAKVRLGLHLYGYSWQRGTPPATAVTWRSVNRWIEGFQLAIMRNTDDMEANVELDVRGLPRQTIYFADSVGIAYKLGLVTEMFPGLGGVAIWGLGGEDPAAWDIIESVSHGDCIPTMGRSGN
jgi:spore germination protein YaaH